MLRPLHGTVSVSMLSAERLLLRPLLGAVWHLFGRYQRSACSGDGVCGWQPGIWLRTHWRNCLGDGSWGWLHGGLLLTVRWWT